MAAHALLSASGADRWINCPPSARLEEHVKDEQSPYAAEGTTAHALAEASLSYQLDLITENEYNNRKAELEINPEMCDYIEDYCEAVIERINQARAVSKDAKVMLEHRLDFSKWVPKGFGTGDVVLVYDGVVEVIDLKYGKGVPVAAEGNPQMRLYALGALDEFEFLYGIETVRATIIQPRLDNISTEEIKVDDLLYWATNTVMGAAEKAWNGEGELKAGGHCRFCKVRARCRARAKANLELTKYEFKEQQLLTTLEIAEILGKAEELQAWVKDVQGYALEQAVKYDIDFPGWKLVEGRSNRKYADEDQVAATLIQAGLDEQQIYEKKLLGITKMEKELGKKIFNELLTRLVVKPAGKPTLVPESDKRPAISSAAAAAEDFK